MTERTDKADIEQGRYDPAPTRDTDELPTAYGGTTGVEPQEPGQSLGRVPDPDDADVDEAGDHPDPDEQGPRGRREGAQPRADIDTSGTTAKPSVG
jgi:hypothetical protein